jgi:hypothetical protein
MIVEAMAQTAAVLVVHTSARIRRQAGLFHVHRQLPLPPARLSRRSAACAGGEGAQPRAGVEVPWHRQGRGTRWWPRPSSPPWCGRIHDPEPPHRGRRGGSTAGRRCRERRLLLRRDRSVDRAGGSAASPCGRRRPHPYRRRDADPSLCLPGAAAAICRLQPAPQRPRDRQRQCAARVRHDERRHEPGQGADPCRQQLLFHDRRPYRP